MVNKSANTLRLLGMGLYGAALVALVAFVLWNDLKPEQTKPIVETFRDFDLGWEHYAKEQYRENKTSGQYCEVCLNYERCVNCLVGWGEDVKVCDIYSEPENICEPNTWALPWDQILILPETPFLSLEICGVVE